MDGAFGPQPVHAFPHGVQHTELEALWVVFAHLLIATQVHPEALLLHAAELPPPEGVGDAETQTVQQPARPSGEDAFRPAFAERLANLLLYVLRCLGIGEVFLVPCIGSQEILVDGKARHGDQGDELCGGEPVLIRDLQVVGCDEVVDAEILPAVQEEDLLVQGQQGPA